MKLTVTLSAKEASDIGGWLHYYQANPQYIGVPTPSNPASPPNYQSRIVLDSQVRERFDEIAAQFIPVPFTTIDVVWGDTSRFLTRNIVQGGFGCNAIAVRFMVPTTANFTKPGLISIAEYQGPPTLRQLVLTPNAGDFNAFPLAQSTGVEASIYFGTPDTVPLIPGQSYYFNMRNYDVVNNKCSCPTTDCAASFDFKWPT